MNRVTRLLLALGLLAVAFAPVVRAACVQVNCLWGVQNTQTCQCDCIGESTIPTATAGYCKDATGVCSVVREYDFAIAKFKPCTTGNGVVNPSVPTYRFTSPPVGGAFTWDTRSLQVISWDVQRPLVGETVQLFFVPINGGNQIPITTAPIPATSLAVTWTVPADLVSGSTWQIRLVSSSGVTLVNAAVITVRQLIPSSGYRFTGPTTSTIWYTKTGQFLSWDVQPFIGNTDRVTLLAINSQFGTVTTLASNIPATDLAFLWNIPANFAPGGYRFRLQTPKGSIDSVLINILSAFW
ncbi:hypothetical protein HK102_002033 [Quaeritorhiza haematococci]|nr:hypothetical protein HK102_002033 [Quaeritorhiza haematococci]